MMMKVLKALWQFCRYVFVPQRENCIELKETLTNN